MAIVKEIKRVRSKRKNEMSDMKEICVGKTNEEIRDEWLSERRRRKMRRGWKGRRRRKRIGRPTNHLEVFCLCKSHHFT